MILVFGKTGQVATELQRQADVIALGRDEADLERPGRCADAILQHAPDVVINAAAWTAVDQAEAEMDRAMRVNADAPGAMARACVARGIPFLHVSTDYVFDGSGDQPWAEDDHPSPLGAYGRTKLEGEKLVRAAGGNHAILRTSWVFSAHGANFVKTMLRLAETRDKLTVVADQIGGPTPAADIAATLLTMARAMRAGQGGGTYHYGGQPHVSWADFSREIFAQAGKAVEVADIPSSDYPTPAKRPLNSRLDCAKLAAEFGVKPPLWKDGLAAVLAELGEGK
ncbi:dTDP-4-dehydrorhamnose reductase [Actibacterium sp. XHP0104]|uniref:dTDP-4-dehydrorhamnose reductase n=1 Tax=Actibacterium sp. XHP0104 TaxID=2984335 RepID=UPI0021E93A88|nr:dTDP-4-dehydrorhamnose reductase [Actibacterium sp. XHP0104]MCV2881829.1 dTDP-4-dehydrorhamnose reductase [Actibacterium sp. XHP0104]